MLVPKFSLSQDDLYIVVRINVPHIRVSNAEIVSEGKEFSFYCKPYLLKLTFPFDVDDSNGNASTCRAEYDPGIDDGTITAYLAKAIPGQHFPDLDLTSKLLLPARTFLQPRIEVVSEDSNNVTDVIETDSDLAVTRSMQSLQILSPRYGFNLQYSCMLNRIQEDLIELSNPDSTPENSRSHLRLIHENNIFDPEIYLGNYFDAENDTIYSECMEFEPPWVTAWKIKDSKDTLVEFNEVEKQAMASLKSQIQCEEFKLAEQSQNERRVFLGLIDILFAICFDYRTTCGESNVESCVNITRLSPTLSWLHVYDSSDVESNLSDGAFAVIIACCRRAMIYSYIRHWKVARRELADVSNPFDLNLHNFVLINISRLRE